MPTQDELKQQARAKVRSILASSNSFRNMNKDQQFAFYKDLVDSTYQELLKENESASNTSVAKSFSVPGNDQ
jgi:hypothetical protein